ncbi:MAG TPA: pyridoxamine 5'-phosphate oxidase family protein [Saprospiraceae bacterium]|nr:pyridoxamine 5'-phosphate oxidase family protein [Saprospiraceae bacterium]
MITEEMKMAMQGMIPSVIATCDAEGMPNTTVISQTYFVDENHIAISHQFFNKTIRNIRAVPKACLVVTHPEEGNQWKMQVEYSHSETEGELFENMSMQLEAIASMVGMEDVFQLKAAEVFKVLSVEHLY